MKLQVAGRGAYAYTGGRPFPGSTLRGETSSRAPVTEGPCPDLHEGLIETPLPTVVFIHGGEHDHCVWVLQSRYLAHHGYGVLAVDLPGHGRSAGEPLRRIEDMADWIVAVLDAAGVRRAALVGHSMGSLVALECAARHSERVTKIALLAAAFPMRVSPQLLAAAQSDEPAAHDMINVWSHSSQAHFPGNPGPGFWVIGENLRLMQRQRPGVLYADFAACDDYAAGLERAAAVRCPALFLLGARDAMTPPRAAKALAQAVSGAAVTMLADCGHNMMGEKPDEVLDALRGFLERPDRSG